MIKAIIFDADGMIIKSEKYFSQRYSDDHNIPTEKILPFFQNEFQLCLIDKADIKTELAKYTTAWGWSKSVDELLDYWFRNESRLDEKVLASIKEFRSKGIQCYLHTNNEKYRVQYLLDTVGLRHHLDGVFSSAQIGYKKPEREFWSAVHEQIVVTDKSQIVVWDDDADNIESARAYGFVSEMYTDFGSYEKRMKSLVG